MNLKRFLIFSLLLIILFLVVNSVSATGDIIGWWHFSNNTNDSSGNSLNGNLRNGAVVNKSILELPNAGSHLSISDNDLLTFNNGSNDLPFSISLWIYLDDMTSTNIIRKGDSGTTYEYRFMIDSSDRIAFLIFDSVGSTCSRGRRSDSMSAFEDQWIYLTATYDGGGDYSGIKVYLNTSQIDVSNTGNGAEGCYDGMENEAKDLLFGEGADNLYDRKIDDIRIYNKELSLTEIQQIYNYTRDQYEDQTVEITASVDPTLSLSLSSTTCSLNTFSTTNIRTCSYNVTVTTNGTGGYSAYIREVDDLKNSASDVISDTASSYITSGGSGTDEEYGIGVSTQDTADVFPDYSGVDTCANLDNDTISLPAEPITSDDQRFATYTDPADGGSNHGQTTICHGAAIIGTTPAGVYSHDVLITVVGNF